MFYHGTAQERKQLKKKLTSKSEVNNNLVYPVVVTSYQIAVIEKSVLQKIEWKLLIVDEGHVLKNCKTQLFQ